MATLGVCSQTKALRRLAGWLAGLLACWPAGLLACLPACLPACLLARAPAGRPRKPAHNAPDRSRQLRIRMRMRPLARQPAGVWARLMASRVASRNLRLATRAAAKLCEQVRTFCRPAAGPMLHWLRCLALLALGRNHLASARAKIVLVVRRRARRRLRRSGASRSWANSLSDNCAQMNRDAAAGACRRR